MPIEWISGAGSAIFEWGPRAFDYIEHRGSPYTSEEFVERYAESVRDAIDLVPDVMSFNEAELRVGIAGCLQHMAALVQAYHGGKGVEVNANYMVAHAPTQQLLEEARFCRRERRADSYRCFLVLEQWAKLIEALPTRLVLPVEKEEEGDILLFGAPMAYMTNKAQMVTDTTEYSLFTRHESQRVRSDMKEYFDRHTKDFQSFVSIPIPPPQVDAYVPRQGCSANVMAVVNIQCSRKNILGRVAANQRKLLMVLVPLVHVLSYYLLRMNAISVAQTPAL